MSKIISRIQQFAENQGISNRELERSIGVSEGLMSKAFRNNTEIRTDNIEKIAESFPHLSAEWLLRGTGEMLVQMEDSMMQNPTLDFVVRHMASQIDELKAEIKSLEAKNDDLLKERNDLLISNRNLEYMIDLARKGEIASPAVGSSDADAV